MAQKPVRRVYYLLIRDPHRIVDLRQFEISRKSVEPNALYNGVVAMPLYCPLRLLRCIAHSMLYLVIQTGAHRIRKNNPY